MYIELIDSYIFEVTKHLSRKEKSRLSESLEEEIYKKIDEYMADKDYDEPTYEDVKEILWHFGSPEDIANEYSRDNYRPYISSPYSRLMKTDFKIAWLVIALTIIGSSIIAFSLRGQNIIEIIFMALGSLIISFILVYFMFTFSFASVSNNRLKRNKKAYIDSIVAKPDRSNTIGKFAVIVQIIVASLLVGIFGFSERILDFSYPNIIILEEVKVDLFVIIMLVYFMAVLSIAYKDIDRRYSFGVVLTTVLANLGAILLAGLIFALKNMEDTLFQRGLASILPENGATDMIISNLGIIIFFIAVAVGVLNIVYSVISYHTDKKQFGQVYDPDEFEEYGEDQYYEDIDQQLEDEKSLEENEDLIDSQIEEDEKEKELEETTVFSQSLIDNQADQEDSFDETRIISKDEIREEDIEADTNESNMDETMVAYSKEDIDGISEIETKSVNDQETIASYTRAEIEEGQEEKPVDKNTHKKAKNSIADSIKKSNPENM